MLSLMDSERLYSVELDRDVIFCVEPRQKSPSEPCPPERMFGLNPNSDPKSTAAAATPATTADWRKGPPRAEEASPKESDNDNTQQPVGRDVVPSTLLQEISHPQVATLERQRQELLEINRTWDKQYRRMKQHYEAKIQQLLDRLLACDRRATEADEELERKQRDFDEKMLRAKETIESTEKRNSTMNADLLELERHMRQLKLQYDSLTTRGRQQGCEIRRLNKALQESQAEAEETKTELEVLRHQANIYKTDFNLERQDRERLKTENLEIKKKVAKLHAQMQKLCSQVKGQQQTSCPCAGHSACPTRNTKDSSRT
ncbi:TNFAIP3-interacting protein 1-like isoform X1 [Scleropages formosus]|uniref:TNFAIP3-interacting protein 1-like isoform X1 n=1 Tax=Scleropages formosus TaxID=113540 RepID=UPI0008782BF3|nr:TNFAIP3-interacting protein 1-like isoform X1 [Scleropages formosus]